MTRFLIFCSILVGCGKQFEHHSSISFTEVESIIAPAVCGNDFPTQIIEVNGTGLALIDYDNDGDLDLFVVNASNENCRMYENVSVGSIVFDDVTEKLGVNVQGWGNGVAVGDFNGDGFDDLYITCHGPNVLLQNVEGDTFKDITTEAGVGNTGWGTSARFGDLDGDGDLDLYVCNYLEYDVAHPPARAKYKGHNVLGGPHGMTPQQDVVYENTGNGRFRDVTIDWGFVSNPAFSLNATILDMTGNGKQDVFVGNDSMANNLWVNVSPDDSTPQFVNKGLHTGIAANGDGSMQATMGIAIADVNGNSRPDVFTTNFSSDTNTLHTNDVSGFFDDRTTLFGLGLASRTLLGWTCGFHDFDLDGDEDLFIVNGHVYPEATYETMDSSRNQPVLLYERVGNRFKQVEQKGEFRDRAAVFGDLDKDGDTDIIVSERNGNVRVLRNDAQSQDTFSIHLLGKEGNPNGLGATLHVRYKDGSTVSRWNTDGAGFQSSTSVQPFMLAKKGEIIQIEVIWANGEVQVVTDVLNPSSIKITQN